MTPTTERQFFFTLSELAQHLHVHNTTIYRLLRKQQLPGFKVGGSWRFSTEAIAHWETAQEIRRNLEEPRYQGTH